MPEEAEGVPIKVGAFCFLDSSRRGIVAKHKYRPYVTVREQSTWFRIRNRRYSQWESREELFERDRSSEPVPGWHSPTFPPGRAVHRWTFHTAPPRMRTGPCVTPIPFLRPVPATCKPRYPEPCRD